GLTPADIFFYRFLLAYVCMVAVSHRRMWSACYSLLMLGLVASTGGFLVWNRVMKVLGAVRVTNYVYFQSLLTMTVGAVVLHERVTWMALLGCMVLIGGMLVALNSGKKAKAAQATT
ncbi:MAG: EamA family transporter, partial [Bacteroidaceae bacterium]|nr:EamA family transporter [Bacteroidaceae bacterium]